MHEETDDKRRRVAVEHRFDLAAYRLLRLDVWLARRHALLLPETPLSDHCHPRARCKQVFRQARPVARVQAILRWLWFAKHTTAPRPDLIHPAADTSRPDSAEQNSVGL